MQNRRIAGFFLSHVESFVRSQGSDASGLYEAIGLDPVSFDHSNDTISERQLYDFVLSARARVAIEDFGLKLGRSFGANSFGLLSRAVLSAVTLGDIIYIIERYSVLVMPLLNFSGARRGQYLDIEIQVNSSHPEFNQIVLEALYAAAQGAEFFLIGKGFSGFAFCFSFSKPAYAAAFEKYGSTAVKFGAERNLMTLKYDDLKQKVVTGNATDYRISIEDCDRKLAAMSEALGLVEQVLEKIRRSSKPQPSSADVAASLSITERTMRRRLALEGSNFRELLNQIKAERAQYYLTRTGLSVAQIATRLGYNETASFRTAFKSWTGYSPRAWRQRQFPD